MTDEEWETALKSMNEYAKKWVGEEIDVISNGEGGYVATLPDGRGIAFGI